MENEVNISPAVNALDSLKRVARELSNWFDVKDNNPLQLKGVIAWSWHAVGLLAYLRLSPGRQLFDSWVQDYLHEGSPELNIERDANWEERERLSFLELIDIFSEKELPSLKPEFYQGWQDRVSRCQWLREQAYQMTGFSLSTDDIKPLLLLLAVYHRLVRLPAGVQVNTEKVINSIPALFDLIEKLIDKEWIEANDLYQALNQCRKSF